MIQPPVHLWEVTYKRKDPYTYAMVRGECIATLIFFKSAGNFWAIKAEGVAHFTRGFKRRDYAVEYVLDWINGPTYNNGVEPSHLEFSTDGMAWSKKDMPGRKFMRWITVGLTVPSEPQAPGGQHVQRNAG